jgi:glyoxylase I family protein
MISPDHMILRVRNQAESIGFYQQILTFKHEGRADPFDILRVHEGFTLDLMEQVPQDQVHLAFCLERAAFEAVHRRLI